MKGPTFDPRGFRGTDDGAWAPTIPLITEASEQYGQRHPEFDAPSVPWKQTASGRAFPLICPQHSDVDFDVDIAGELSRLARFTGDIRGGAYSIAQHSVVGADILMQETGDRDMAAAFVLHDAHEGVIGDIATPAQQAISFYLQETLREHGLAPRPVKHDSGGMLHLDFFRISLKRLKKDLDSVIYGSAGISWPLSVEIAAAVHFMDLRMLAAEVDAFMGGEVAPWGSLAMIRKAWPIPDLRPIGIWPAEVAETRFQEALRRYLPERFPHPAFSIED